MTDNAKSVRRTKAGKGGNQKKSDTAARRANIRAKVDKAFEENSQLIKKIDAVLDPDGQEAMRLMAEIKSAKSQADIAKALRAVSGETYLGHTLNMLAEYFDPEGDTPYMLKITRRKAHRPGTDHFSKAFRAAVVFSRGEEQALAVSDAAKAAGMSEGEVRDLVAEIEGAQTLSGGIKSHLKRNQKKA
jgi:seryl-tRNA synthetase